MKKKDPPHSTDRISNSPHARGPMVRLIVMVFLGSRRARAGMCRRQAQKRGGVTRPFTATRQGRIRIAKAYSLSKVRNCSLPTKPNLLTPEPLMMFRTLADWS